MTKKTGLQKSVQGILSWTLVPIVIGAIIGLFTKPFITPFIGAVSLLSVSSLVAAILAMRRGDMPGVGGWWLLWFGTFALLGYLLVPKDWTWWIGTVIGAVLSLALTGSLLFVKRRFFAQRSNTTPAPTTNTSPQGVSKTVKEEVNVGLGLNTSEGATWIDASGAVRDLGSQAQANLLHAKAAEGQVKMVEIRELREVINDPDTPDDVKQQARERILALLNLLPAAAEQPAPQLREKYRFDPTASICGPR